ncbi:MAG: hypothetical protein IKK05_03380, partial [Alistipes sp.]|nr:hypothetical protein [Alistipes sp.]
FSCQRHYCTTLTRKKVVVLIYVFLVIRHHLLPLDCFEIRRALYLIPSNNKTLAPGMLIYA